MMLITTSRKPGQLTRAVARTIASALGAEYLNRGKGGLASVLVEAEKVNASKILFVWERYGNPSRLVGFDMAKANQLQDEADTQAKEIKARKEADEDDDDVTDPRITPFTLKKPKIRPKKPKLEEKSENEDDEETDTDAEEPNSDENEGGSDRKKDDENTAADETAENQDTQGSQIGQIKQNGAENGQPGVQTGQPQTAEPETPWLKPEIGIHGVVFNRHPIRHKGASIKVEDPYGERAAGLLEAKAGPNQIVLSRFRLKITSGDNLILELKFR
ncbi:hypothetical protein HY994_00385 [Candidatus Micrarchaeota archaeon]|nr:hypothetical protein [Candidatus Micrarchaeota archaeon]